MTLPDAPSLPRKKKGWQLKSPLTIQPPDLGLSLVDYSRKTEERALEKWQTYYEDSGVGLWTKRMIPRVAMTDLTREMNFYLAQALSGHGAFAAYLHRRKRRDTPDCELCACGCDQTAEHCLKVCPYFEEGRPATFSIDRAEDRAYAYRVVVTLWEIERGNLLVTH